MQGIANANIVLLNLNPTKMVYYSNLCIPWHMFEGKARHGIANAMLGTSWHCQCNARDGMALPMQH
jgi:hypothetical protein